MSSVLKVAGLAFALCLSSLSYAKTLEVVVEFDASSKGAELDDEALKQDGWVSSGDEDYPVFVLNLSLDESELPYSSSIGDAYLSISREGEISLGMSVGDADASASGSMTLPRDANGALLSFSSPIKISVDGGDHASGMWSFNGTASVLVKD